ncbi:hypothetical protein CSHISOI_11640 [Colletotrichum shisoi]|uniref:Uncharacterized protein n=1 Tax=Colletotrichum shisoi TaxID=2078593 RepID=A0A5Q4BB24_9PEZI|nr:hypothetical protein CSHISOI_11640 [Colletotrichum shisoi]
MIGPRKREEQDKNKPRPSNPQAVSGQTGTLQTHFETKMATRSPDQNSLRTKTGKPLHQVIHCSDSLQVANTPPNSLPLSLPPHPPHHSFAMVLLPDAGAPLARQQ